MEMNYDDKRLMAPFEVCTARKTFREELTSLINQHSLENGSNTPDFILSTYLADCLAAYDKATRRRSKWYGSQEFISNE